MSTRCKNSLHSARRDYLRTSTELLSQDSILLAQVVDGMLLLLVHPSGDCNHYKPKWIQAVLHLRSSLSPYRRQVTSAPTHLWFQSNRVLGRYAIRRECLDHMIVFNLRSLHRHLQSFVDYYHGTRTHLGLQKDTPEPRPIQFPKAGRIISIPEVGGLHHRYERRAA